MLEPAQRRGRLEGLRYAAALKQQATQHSTALLHWGALWRQLSSPCGAWALRWAGPEPWALRWAGLGRSLVVAGLGRAGGSWATRLCLG